VDSIGSKYRESEDTGENSILATWHSEAASENPPCGCNALNFGPPTGMLDDGNTYSSQSAGMLAEGTFDSFSSTLAQKTASTLLTCESKTGNDCQDLSREQESVVPLQHHKAATQHEDLREGSNTSMLQLVEEVGIECEDIPDTRVLGVSTSSQGVDKADSPAPLRSRVGDASVFGESLRKLKTRESLCRSYKANKSNSCSSVEAKNNTRSLIEPVGSEQLEVPRMASDRDCRDKDNDTGTKHFDHCSNTSLIQSGIDMELEETPRTSASAEVPLLSGKSPTLPEPFASRLEPPDAQMEAVLNPANIVLGTEDDFGAVSYHEGQSLCIMDLLKAELVSGASLGLTSQGVTKVDSIGSKYRESEDTGENSILATWHSEAANENPPCVCNALNCGPPAGTLDEGDSYSTQSAGMLEEDNFDSFSSILDQETLSTLLTCEGESGNDCQDLSREQVSIVPLCRDEAGKKHIDLFHESNGSMVQLVDEVGIECEDIPVTKVLGVSTSSQAVDNAETPAPSGARVGDASVFGRSFRKLKTCERVCHSYTGSKSTSSSSVEAKKSARHLIAPVESEQIEVLIPGLPMDRHCQSFDASRTSTPGLEMQRESSMNGGIDRALMKAESLSKTWSSLNSLFSEQVMDHNKRTIVDKKVELSVESLRGSHSEIVESSPQLSASNQHVPLTNAKANPTMTSEEMSKDVLAYDVSNTATLDESSENASRKHDISSVVTCTVLSSTEAVEMDVTTTEKAKIASLHTEFTVSMKTNPEPDDLTPLVLVADKSTPFTNSTLIADEISKAAQTDNVRRLHWNPTSPNTADNVETSSALRVPYEAIEMGVEDYRASFKTNPTLDRSETELVFESAPLSVTSIASSTQAVQASSMRISGNAPMSALIDGTSGTDTTGKSSDGALVRKLRFSSLFKRPRQIPTSHSATTSVRSSSTLSMPSEVIEIGMDDFASTNTRQSQDPTNSDEVNTVQLPKSFGIPCENFEMGVDDLVDVDTMQSQDLASSSASGIMHPLNSLSTPSKTIEMGIEDCEMGIEDCISETMLSQDHLSSVAESPPNESKQAVKPAPVSDPNIVQSMSCDGIEISIDDCIQDSVVSNLSDGNPSGEAEGELAMENIPVVTSESRVVLLHALPKSHEKIFSHNDLSSKNDRRLSRKWFKGFKGKGTLSARRCPDIVARDLKFPVATGSGSNYCIHELKCIGETPMEAIEVGVDDSMGRSDHGLTECSSEKKMQDNITHW